MPHGPISAESQSPAVETFFLGQVPYLRCLELQQRLLRQAAQRRRRSGCHPHVRTSARYHHRPGRPAVSDSRRKPSASLTPDRNSLDQSGGWVSRSLSRSTGYIPYSTIAVASFLAGRISSSLSVGFGEYINRTGGISANTSGSVRNLGPDGPDRNVRHRGPRLDYLARGLFECLTAAGVISPRRWRCDGQHRCRALRCSANGNGPSGVSSPAHRCIRL